MSGQLVMSINETFLFLKRWAKTPLQLGSIFPSSKALSSFIARHAAYDENQYVIEIGGGTGAISRALLEAGIPPHKLIIVELDPELTDFLRSILPLGVRVIQGNAENLDTLLPPECIGNISSVVSGLPMRNFPETLKQNIIEACFRAMGGKGSVFQYTYALTSPLQAKSLDVEHQKLGLILQNLPPATVWKYWR